MTGRPFARTFRFALLTSLGLVAARAPAEVAAPNLFGSVALPIGATKDGQRFAAAAAEGDVGAGATRFAAGLKAATPADRLAAVNRYVNGRVHYAADGADHWAPGRETLARGKGDCEDYAIAKMQMLRHAGFASDDLYVSLVTDLVRRENHAVLVVRVADSFYILDNQTDRLMKDSEVRDYRPLLTFAKGKSFTHGYRRGG